MDKFIEFEGRICRVREETYPASGREWPRTRLRLYDKDTGEPILTATVYVPCCPLTPGQVLVSDQDTNAGVLRALQQGGVVVPTGTVFRVGPAEAHICYLLPDAASN